MPCLLISALADAVRAQPDQAYDHIESEFLELAEPSIPASPL